MTKKPSECKLKGEDRDARIIEICRYAEYTLKEIENILISFTNTLNEHDY